jgi:hypothetical protein
MIGKIKILFLFLSLIIFGCVKVLQVDFGEPARKIVLYPFLTANQPITIKMSAPASILVNEFPQLINPIVVITDNDVPADTVIINTSGKGFSDIVPLPDHLYEFYAFAENYPVSSCTAQLPKPVQGIEIDTFHVFARNIKHVNFKLKIKDDPNSNDFYKISINRKKYVTSRISFNHDTSFVTIWNSPVYVNNPIVDFFSIFSKTLLLAKEGFSFTGETHYRTDFGSEVYLNGYDYYFNDVLFNGKETTLNLMVPEVNPTLSPEKYMVELSTLSKDYYQGLKSYAVYGSKEDLDLPIKEEVSIYSAVKGGYGFPVSYVTVCDSTFWITR